MASFSSCSSTEMTVASAPNWRATSLTSSPSSDWLTVTKTPFISRVAMRSLPRTSSFSARSLTEMPSVTVMVLGDGQGLAGDLRAAETRWRLEALHRAFFGLLVALVRHGAGRDVPGADAGRRSSAFTGGAPGAAGTGAEAGTCGEAGTSRRG